MRKETPRTKCLGRQFRRVLLLWLQEAKACPSAKRTNRRTEKDERMGIGLTAPVSAALRVWLQKTRAGWAGLWRMNRDHVYGRDSQEPSVPQS